MSIMASAVILLSGALLQLHQMERCDVDAYLADLHSGKRDFEHRLVDVAKRSVGTLYAGGPLGEGPSGKYDTDPLMDLTRADCVTFVEQAIALAAAESYSESFDLLQKIRYENGAISFETRNHFMIADWVERNTFCVDVTDKLKVPTRSVSRTISKKGFFERVKAPELGSDVADRVVELTYVPVAEAAEAAEHLPSPALIVFVGKVDWLFALHCGLYIRDGDRGLLYHASSKGEAVVTADLAEYLSNTDRYIGYSAYEIRCPMGCAAWRQGLAP